MLYVSFISTSSKTRSVKRFSLFLSTLLFLVSVAVIGCKPDVKTPPAVVTVPEVPLVKRTIPVPAFSGDSAYAHVAAQVAMGPRYANTKAHEQVRAYITSTLERYGAKVTVQDFKTKFYDGTSVTGYNIIGSYNPDSTKRVFLSAHYDTRPIADSPLADPKRYNEPILGADDGGSGVGALLEIARLLHENPFPEMGVDLVFFDLEDNGNPEYSNESDTYSWALGSQHWAKSPHVSGYSPKFGVLLDMVGAKDAVFGREGYSKYYAGQYQNKIWNLAKKMGQGERFVDAEVSPVTDDHYFINTIAGWPTVDIIYKPIGKDGGFGSHWHTHNDNMDIISAETLQSVGQVVTAVVYREAGNML